ncbi:MAG: aldo/keto reductase [Clostridiales bacterium]|nr:aldo/keto reductase [Clostridiales bacterium]
MSENLFDLNLGKLGFGFMRLPQKGDGFDMELVNQMVDAFMASGNTYFDTAFVYRGSEQALCESLVKRYPRESFRIATKLNLGFVDSKEKLAECFETSCKRLGVDYVDFYLLHGLGNRTGDKDDTMGAWTYLSGLKAAGKAKHIGFSFHGTPDKLESILTKHPEAEFVQIQANYIDWEDEEVQSGRLYEICRQYGKPIVVMEPVKGGMLASETSAITEILKRANPAVTPASWAMRFIAPKEGVLVTLSGMNSLEQMRDNLETFKNLKALSEAEMQTVQEAIAALKAVPRIPCTECGYCLESCPQKIKIPSKIEVYNGYLAYQSLPTSRRQYTFTGEPWASACITCHACEEQCPQNIAIPEVLAEITKLFE